MKRLSRPVLLLSIYLLCFLSSFSQTSWTGATSVNWATAANWTAGVPTATTDAIIGDASFTGAFQPTISANATCKSLTVGGTVSSVLTVNRTLTSKGNIMLNPNGSIINANASISLTGNWVNNGVYSATSTNATIIFNGTAQTLGGSVTTTFRKLTINTGSTVTLLSPVISSGPSSLITVSGTLHPNESPTYQVTADNLTVNSNGVLKVTAASFAGNYTINTAFLLSAGSIVDYAATATPQVVSSSYTYSTLRISGTGIKSLSANLPILRSTTSTVGNIYVLSGTFDLSSFTANRGTTIAGGTFSVSNGATVLIGGTNGFPTGFTTTTLSLTSSVVYNGTNQAIAAKTYGNLLLTSAAGAVIKSMPASAFTVAGNLTSSAGSGTSVAFTAASNISVTGTVTIGAATSFDGSSFSHSVTGSFINDGTFTGSTSTVTLRGANGLISGTGVHNFNNLTVTASGVSASPAINLTISGNLTTSGSGTFRHDAPGSITMTGTTKTITGTGIILNNLTISSTVTTASSFTLTGNFVVNGSFTASSGNVTMNGAGKIISGSGAITFRGLLIPGSVTTASNFTIAAALNIGGSFTASAGTATFTGASTITGTANLYNVTENGTSLTLAANAVLGIANVFTVTAGSLNVTTNVPNTVNYNGTGAQTISARPYNNLILSNGATKTAGGAITINNALTIQAATTFAASSFTHTILGNLVNNGTLNAGTSLIQFTGAANTTISGTTVFNNLTINKSTTTNNVTLVSNVTASTINMTNGSLLTGSNNITITTTRTGNGIILGSITRTHVFLPAVSYAFEGPNNTILFSAVSGVNSVTVNVTAAPVADFPFGGAVNRYYYISVPAGTYTATLRLHYEDIELTGNDEAAMQLWKYSGASWAVSGKSANSTTLNYVEKNNITNLNDRWTFTDDGSVLSWNGSVNDDWNNAANWSLVQGIFSGVPGSTDIVELGTTAFTHQPKISNAVTIKGIHFGSTQAITLSMNTGGSLTTNGNIGGVWNTNMTHTIIAGAQNITVNGDLVLSNNTAGHAIDVSIGTGSVTVSGSVVHSGGASILFNGAGILNIGKDYNYTNGIFTAGSGTVNFNGASSQLIGGVTYHNLTISKSAGIASLNDNITINGNLSVNSGELMLANNINVTGSVSIAVPATLHGNNTTIAVGGNWVRSGTFNPGTGTVNFNGSGNQTISAGSFNQLIINKASGTATLSGNILINADVNLTAGILRLSTFTLNHSAPGGVFSIADGGELQISGAANFPSLFTTYAFAGNSLVHYNGTMAQAVEGVNYGNLYFSNGGIKTLSASTVVNGDITINSGASFDGGNFALTLYGNWLNNGNFIPGTGDIILNGTAKTITGNTTFNDVTVNGDYSVAGSNITYNGHLQVTATGSYAAGSGQALVNNDLTNSGVLTSTGTTTFSGTSLQTIRLINALVSASTGVVNFNGNVSPVLNSTSTPVFATLNINNTAGVNPSVNWMVLGPFTVSNGAIFNGGVSTHTFNHFFINNGTITSDGTLVLSPTTDVNVKLSGTNFTSTGTVLFGGTGQITLTGTPTSLHDVVIANTNSAGITPPSGWTVDGKFSVNNNAIFHAGSHTYTVLGDIESDGTLFGGTSTFIMNAASGSITGSPATTFNHFVVAGNITANSDFNVAGDFINNGTFDGTIGAIIMTGNNDASIGGTTTPSTIAQLTVNKGIAATVTAAVDISTVSNLTVAGGTFFTSTYAITQNASGGVLIVAPYATLKLGGTNTIPAFSGYGLDEESTVDYAGTTQTISNSAIYGNLRISTAGNKTAINFLPLVVAGNFYLTAGNFIAGNNTHRFAKDWTMTGGTFTNTASTIMFNGTTDQSITTLAPFNNLSNNKPAGLLNLASNVTVNATLNLTLGKVNMGSNNLVIGSTGTITGASLLKYIIAEGSGVLTQQVVTGGSKVFPVGTNTNYIPATVTLAAGSTTDNFNARVLNGVFQNGGTGSSIASGVVNATWVITEEVAGGSNATISFQWPLSLEQPGFYRSFCFPSRYISSNWDWPSNSVSATGSNPYIVSRAGLNAFGHFAMVTADVLPVTWISINGRNQGAVNQIEWKVENETNTNHYSIEAATNSMDFVEIGNLVSRNAGNGAQTYSFSHTNLKSPVYYYRVKQVDRNGKYSYSPVIKINGREFLSGMTFYPNPLTDKGTLTIHSGQAQRMTFSVFSVSGGLVLKKTLNLQQGTNAIPFDLGLQASGVYVIEIRNDKDEMQMFRVLKK